MMRPTLIDMLDPSAQALDAIHYLLTRGAEATQLALMLSAHEHSEHLLRYANVRSGSVIAEYARIQSRAQQIVRYARTFELFCVGCESNQHIQHIGAMRVDCSRTSTELSRRLWVR
jgi:hypothetical protein